MFSGNNAVFDLLSYKLASVPPPWLTDICFCPKDVSFKRFTADFHTEGAGQMSWLLALASLVSKLTFSPKDTDQKSGGSAGAGL